MSKDLRVLVRQLEKAGWRVRHGRKHVVAFPPDLAVPAVTFGCTPSDHRAWENNMARLRRSGFSGNQ
jgi:hypothetical protein